MTDKLHSAKELSDTEPRPSTTRPGLGEIPAITKSDGKSSGDGPSRRSGAPFKPAKNCWEELVGLTSLAAGMCVTWMGWTIKETMDIIVIGQISVIYAEAVALVFLWTEATFSIALGSVLSVFASQAAGADNPTVAGVYLQVALVVQGVVGVFVGVAWASTGWVLEALGYSENIVSIAKYYTFVMLLRLPARIIGDLLTQYFSGLRMIAPGIVASIGGVLLNFTLLILIAIVLGGGFYSIPIITSSVQWMEVGILVGVYWCWKRIHIDYWPVSGWSWSNVTCTRIIRFAKLNFPAGLSMSSGCWRQAVIAVFASAIGETSVLVYSSAYRLTYMFIIITSGFNAAMVVRSGNAFGATHLAAAKLSMKVAFAVVLGVATVTSAALVAFSSTLGSVFSSDEGFLAEFYGCRYAMAAFNFTYIVAHHVQFMPIAMGRSDVTFWCAAVGSWVVQVPMVWALTRYWMMTMTSVFAGVSLGYIVMALGLAGFVLTVKWEKVAAEAKVRAEVVVNPDTM